jgi:hypothetical protein
VTDKVMVPRLTAEQIEEWRACLSRMYAGEFSNMAQIEALCDMALSSLHSGVMTKTVPVEPTGVMLGLIAGEGTNDPPLLTRDQALIVYRAVLAAAPSPAPVIEEPKEFAQVRASKAQTYFQEIALAYIDSLRAALVEAEEKARECYAFADVQRETAEQAAKEAIFFKHRAEQAESALAAAKAGVAPRVGEERQQQVEDADYIIAKLEQRVLPEHGGTAHSMTHHWNLTVDDSAMHQEAAALIRALKGDTALKSKEGGAG